MAKTQIITRDPTRDALAKAIATLAQAERDSQMAIVAHEKASERLWAAVNRLEAIQEKNSESDDDVDAYVAAFASGDASVAELEAPSKARATELESAEREVATLERAQDALRIRIDECARAIESARYYLDAAVAEALRSSIDVAQLLKEAEAAAADIVAKRAVLRFLCRALPANSEDYRALNEFLSRAWLIDELGNVWERNPAIARYREFRDALLRDADASLPVS